MTENQFITNQVEKLKQDRRQFPLDFIESGLDSYEFKIPDSKLVLGEELFGKYEVLDLKGNAVLLPDDFYLAKYLIYSSHYVTGEIKIPKDNNKLIEAVKLYEKYLDNLLKMIEGDMKKILPESKNSNKILNLIFNSLNLRRY